MSQMLHVEHFFFECGHFRKIMHTWRASGCLITIYILPEAIHVITIHITIRILLSKCFYPERYWISILLMFGKTPKTRGEALAQTWKLSENWEIREAMRRTSRTIQLEGLWNVTHLGRGSKLMQNLSHSTSMVYLPTIYRRNYPSYR